jgi:hypothetical protein
VSLDLFTRTAFYFMLYPVTRPKTVAGKDIYVSEPLVTNIAAVEMVALLPFVWKMNLATAMIKRQVHLTYITWERIAPDKIRHLFTASYLATIGLFIWMFFQNCDTIEGDKFTFDEELLCYVTFIYSVIMSTASIISGSMLHKSLNFGLQRTMRKQVFFTTMVCQLLIISAAFYVVLQVTLFRKTMAHWILIAYYAVSYIVPLCLIIYTIGEEIGPRPAMSFCFGCCMKDKRTVASPRHSHGKTKLINETILNASSSQVSNPDV